MIHLQAGYIIDEIFELYYNQKGSEDFEEAIAEFSKFCYFELTGLETFELNESTEGLDKRLLIAYNIINRGTPTRASIFVTKEILSQYGYQIDENNERGDIVFHRSNTELINISNDVATIDSTKNNNRDVYNLIYTPILIAQIQKTFLVLWLNKKVSFSKELRIHCNVIMKQCFKWAFMDLFELIENLYVLHPHPLDSTPFERPTLVFSGQEDANFSLGIGEQGYKYTISSIIDSENIIDRVLTNKKISYPPIGNYNIKNEFVPFEKQQNSLIYFLNNLFRKIAFRDGQLPIINRILQCKDVIGILPTGSGKSLTYQLCTLLQPGVSVIIDPIRSLMIDQYDKLRMNFIDKTLYINSFDTKEERIEKLELLSKGKIQFAIIGPERFQMLEFRNYMRDFVANKMDFSYSVIDEAHCISEWGHDFRYSYLRLRDGIFKYCFNENKSEFSQIALTATASFDVIADIQRELKMAEDVLVSIPPEAIDRKELMFKIEEIPNPDFIDDNSAFYIREKEVGRIKYPRIKQVIKSIPQTLFLNLDSTKKENFFLPINGKYEHCGLLFCPTKSDTLGNGVVANFKGFWTVSPYSIKFIEGLDKENSYLNCTTFMGQSDDGSVVADVSSNSFENQKAFLANKHNLMIATKAFGMGIDKPNIRYTIHYSIPQSVESFYQEAGRAGRDRRNSINYIFYNQFDVETNYDFIKNAHKSFTRERNIYNEILTEVKYESKFFTKIIEKRLNDVFKKELYKERFKIFLPDDKPHIYILNNYKKSEPEFINYGYFDFKKNEIKPKKDAFKDVLNELKKCIKELFLGADIKQALRENKQKGLEDIINETNEGFKFLNIGFENDTVEELAALIPSYKEDVINPIIDELRRRVVAFQMISDNNAILKILKKKIILDAYDFTNNADDKVSENKFLENLDFEYKRLVNYSVDGINLSEENKLKFKTDYWKIRSEQDTMRAVYRLSIVGVIDDYVVDYRDRRIFIKFSGKTDDGYKSNFEQYLRRYLGKQSTDKWLEKAYNREEETELRKYLFTLTDFFEATIADKRLASAKFMDDLCKEYIHNKNKGDAEKKFRENIVFYFTSKYANELVEKINNYENQEDFQIFLDLIDKIENPPENEVGLELNNAKHILGACQRYKSLGQENNIINLLSSFSTLLLEGKVNGHLPNFSHSNIVKEQVNSSLSAFYYFSQFNGLDYNSYLYVLKKYTGLMKSIIPETTIICNQIYNKAALFILDNKLKTFINKFIT